jgi:hypothetical protein
MVGIGVVAEGRWVARSLGWWLGTAAGAASDEEAVGRPLKIDQSLMGRGRSGVTDRRPRRRQESAGTQEPWNPNGTRAGRCTVATGGPANEVASRMTTSLASRAAS